MAKKYFITLLSCLRVHFRLRILKAFEIRLEVSRYRQILSEYDMALMMPIYK